MLRPCDNCGKMVRRFGRAGQSEHAYCSRSCRAKWLSAHISGEAGGNWRADKIEVPCAVCGVTVRPTPSKMQRNKSHLCSKMCADTAKRTGQKPRGKRIGRRPPITVPCAQCGAGVQRWPFAIRAYARNYCSRKCRGEYRTLHFSGENSWEWRGGAVEYRGPNWQVQRRTAKRRDGFRCQHCGVEAENGKDLEVHHIRPFRTFGYIPGVNETYKRANHLSNLITLCRLCHKRAEPRDTTPQLVMRFG
jgi:5-methylcytosine-specific restriction endonuclease McrA